jgi:hypothetical protein
LYYIRWDRFELNFNFQAHTATSGEMPEQQARKEHGYGAFLDEGVAKHGWRSWERSRCTYQLTVTRAWFLLTRKLMGSSGFVGCNVSSGNLLILIGNVGNDRWWPFESGLEDRYVAIIELGLLFLNRILHSVLHKHKRRVIRSVFEIILVLGTTTSPLVRRCLLPSHLHFITSLYQWSIVLG